jgi:hypothetical protein
LSSTKGWTNGPHPGLLFDTIFGDAIGSGKTWTCEVTPNDGEADGPLGTAGI